MSKDSSYVLGSIRVKSEVPPGSAPEIPCVVGPPVVNSSEQGSVCRRIKNDFTASRSGQLRQVNPGRLAPTRNFRGEKGADDNAVGRRGGDRFLGPACVSRGRAVVQVEAHAGPRRRRKESSSSSASMNRR